MQITLHIQNGNQNIFNALKAFLKTQSDLEFYIEKNTHRQIHHMNKEDEDNFQETLRLLEKGELKFVSAEEMKKRTDERLQKLKEKYA
ncbi:MAG: hypothetical protein J6M43_01785 [Neisseriaceae bacterium]|nr:hypothetical protein [Neisseriaceae bacterium]